MVEVFKTNVSDSATACYLVAQLHEKFRGCKANFDLDDCDLILRIQYVDDTFSVAKVIALLEQNGFMASVLADDVMWCPPQFDGAEQVRTIKI